MQSIRVGFAAHAAALMLFCSLCGCRSAIQCCTQNFAARGETAADLSPIPDRAVDAGDAEQTEHHSSDSGRTMQVGDAESATTAESQPPLVNAGTAGDRFRVPDELPGAQAPLLSLPPYDATQTPEQRLSLAESLFPQVAPADSPPSPEDEYRLTLSALQQMALEHSPIVRQAAADMEQARGKAVQAGLYPNPTAGYQGDTIGTARTAGYNGVFFSQEFVTADKLTIAQSALLMELRAVEAELRKARITLATSVRRGYFEVLVGQEQVKFRRAIARLSEEVYQGQIELVAGGEAAPYEPLQLRVFAVQARNSVVQAQNQLQATWRQLAASIGIPDLPRHRLAGDVDVSIPAVDYSQAAAILMQRHTDLIAAQARISGASGNLRLQQVTPIPNVSLYAAFLHDDTTPLSDFSANLQLSVPVPIFDRNQGNIISAHGQLVKANQNLQQLRNQLMASLADIHARQTTSLMIADSFRRELLPDQVRVYRGVYQRFRVDGDGIDFSQLVVAQQTLAQVVEDYLEVLSEQWEATVALAEILQVDDLMTMDGLLPENLVLPTDE